jgi:hypothetical protein
MLLFNTGLDMGILEVGVEVLTAKYRLSERVKNGVRDVWEEALDEGFSMLPRSEGKGFNMLPRSKRKDTAAC